ncbi:MAG: sulfite exporter TauE/SafE family protein [Pseudomonadota bacterium]
MDLDVSFYLIAAPAVLFAGISKGGFGGGAAFAGSTLLALALEPVQAVAMMLPLLMVMDLAAVRSYWGKWSPEHGRRLILGGLPGIAAGAVLFAVVSADVVRLLIGAVALGFVAYRIALSRGVLVLPTREVAPVEGYFWGAMTGFTSFVSHAGGPPSAVYLLRVGLDKLTYQSTTVMVFWAVNASKMVVYLAMGLMLPQLWLAILTLVPVGLLGVALGVWAHKVVPEKLFFQVTYVLLTATGVKLIFDALT